MAENVINSLEILVWFRSSNTASGPFKSDSSYTSKQRSWPFRVYTLKIEMPEMYVSG